MKDPNKVLIPRDNLILVALRKDEPDHHISFAPLIHVPLDINHGSMINGHLLRWIGVLRRWSGSRRQVSNRI